jgi:hypothetical protein
MRVGWPEPAGPVRIDLVVHARDVPRRPGLRVEAGRPRLITVCRGDRPLVRAHVERDFYGYWYAREGVDDGPGVLPPWRADEARAHRGPAAWARPVIRRLAEAGVHTPLTEGRWTLEASLTHLDRPRRVPMTDMPLAALYERRPLAVVGLAELPALPEAGYQDWNFGQPDPPVMPLRRFSPASHGRVKAWRKHALDGTLPPLLFMWCSGLQRHLLLDGHDRLIAAIAEGVAPPALVLTQVRELPGQPLAAADAVMASVAHRLAANPDHRDRVTPRRGLTVDRANEILVDAYAEVRPYLRAVSRAFPLTGGALVHARALVEGTRDAELREAIVEDLAHWNLRLR